MPQDRVTLKIPRPLYERAKTVIKGSGFSSVNEFVIFVLRDLLSSPGKSKRELSVKEIEAIQEKLKTLGYL